MEPVDLLRWFATFGGIIAAYLTVARFIRYWQQGQKIPLLLIRDTVFMSAIGVTYITVATMRLSTGTGPSDALADSWVLFSRIAYSVAFWTYIYFEWRMVD